MIVRLAVAVLAALICAAPAVAAPTLPLSHDGRFLTDADGRAVLLHGPNMVYKRPPYAPDAIGFDADDARFLAREGYNAVRVGIIYAGVEPERGRYDDAYLDRIARTVRLLGRHGIVSQLDFHQDLYNERFEGEGWPDWAVYDDGLPAAPKLGFPTNYVAMPALKRAFDSFWANRDGVQTRYAKAWAHVAKRFRRDPDVMGYDLMNEPWPGSAFPECTRPEGCPAFDRTLDAFNRRVLKAIRRVDRTTLVFYEPNVLFNSGPRTYVGDLDDDHLGFSFHDYCPTTGPACDDYDDRVFANARAQTRRTGDVSLLTEFGATKDPAVLGPMADRADRDMIGWLVWHYCGCDDPTTTGPGDAQALVLDPAKAPRGANLDRGKLALLSRPYPRVVAGRPIRFGFADGVFRMRWRARKGRTEVVLPRRQYPDGYRVAAGAGVRVRSGRGARVLVVTARRGTRRLAVERR